MQRRIGSLCVTIGSVSRPTFTRCLSFALISAICVWPDDDDDDDDDGDDGDDADDDDA